MTKIDKLVGFDPGFETLGIAVYKPSTKELVLRSGNIIRMINWFGNSYDLTTCGAIVENPGLDSPVFGEWQNMVAAFEGRTLKNNLSEVHSVFKKAMKHAKDVGRNSEMARLVIQMLHNANVPFLEVAPSQRQRAFREKNGKKIRLDVRFLKMPTKTTQKQFKILTGYSSPSSDHARDAATLIHDRSVAWFLNQLKLKVPPTIPGTHNGNYYIVKRNKN